MSDALTRRSVLKLSLASAAFGRFMLWTPQAQAATGHRWWKEAVVYQIFPRSFADSNGDGIGDLPGIIEKVDYLHSLGVTAVWLNPHYDTPNVDSGYDIRDYRKVNPDFGTMEDFDRLVAALRARGIRLIVDLVANHTSNEHAWFRESRKSRDNPYRDYYIWRDGRWFGAPPNNYPSIFGGSAWKEDEATGQYYMHSFAEAQPDLNWDNPRVRQEIYDIMRFWLDKGVDGFRMDTIAFISKPAGFRDLRPEELRRPDLVYADGPNLHNYIQEMNSAVLSGGDYLTVGEAFGVPFERTPLFVSEGRHELGMLFRFDVIHLGHGDWQLTPWGVPDLKAAIAGEDQSSGPDGWLTTFFENHDNPRSVSYFGDGSPASAKALALLLFARRGTPFIFQGQEIGMTNFPFKSVDEFEDLVVRGIWADAVTLRGESPKKVLDGIAVTSRDNSRTPMQWNADPKAGFTTGVPWFHVNPNTAQINVASEEGDPASVLAFYKRLIALRAAHPALIYGTFSDTDPGHPKVFALLRDDGQQRLLIVINFSAEVQPYHLPPALAAQEILIDTHGGAVSGAAVSGTDPQDLHPWQGRIYRLGA